MNYPYDYLEALRYLLGAEGGPSGYSWDPGGHTVFGIAKAYWPEYWVNGPPTLEDAKRFYLVEFWGPLRLSALRDQDLRIEIFEASVNCGMRNGVCFAQSAFNLLRPEKWRELLVDGVMGPKSVRSLNRMAGRYKDALLAGCNFFQARYYVNMSDGLKKHALRGWFSKRLAWPARQR